MDLIFILFPLLFLSVFGLIIGIFAATIYRNVTRNRKDNASPMLTVEATVVTKRTHIWGDHSHTDYYATFEVESGDRLELQIPRDRFGYLVEGDRGKLTFQGSRFLDFARTL